MSKNPIYRARKNLYNILLEVRNRNVGTESSKINRLYDIIESNNEMVDKFGSNVIEYRYLDGSIIDLEKDIMTIVSSNLDFSKLSRNEKMIRIVLNGE